MGRLKVTTLNLDEDDVEELKKRGMHNISEVARRAISATLSDYFDDVEIFLKMNMLEDNIEKIDDMVFAFNRKINNLNKRKESLLYQYENLKSEHEVIQRTTKLSSLIQRLNSQIVSNKFDPTITITTSQDLITQILQLNPKFDLISHIERMKVILDY